MSMLSNGTKVVAFHDDHKPVKVSTYREDGLIEVPISEPVDQEQTGTNLTFENTYNDTAEVTVYGESQQKTLSGKNLVVYPFPYQVNTPKSQTINGVTWINNGDGSLTVSGTATKISYYNLDFTTDITPLIGKTVTISNGSSNIQLRLDAFTNLDDKTYKSLGSSIAGGGFVSTFIIPDNALVMRMWLEVRADETVNETVYPQIELGTKATEYEPYCGGIPSPNPDYPQEITSLTKANATSCGRNLCGKFTFVGDTVNGITTEWTDDGYIWVHGHSTSKVTFGVGNWYESSIKWEKGTVLTESVSKNDLENMVENGVYAQLNQNNGERGFITLGVTNNTTVATGTVSHGVGKTLSGFVGVMDFMYDKDVDCKFRVKLEKGSTPTPWEPDKQSTIDLTSLLNGKQLRSLSRGTRDELIVERDGTVKFVQRVWSGTTIGRGSVVTDTKSKYSRINYVDGVTIPSWKSYEDSVDDGSVGRILCNKLIDKTNRTLNSTYVMIGRTWNGVFLYASPDADDSIFDVGEIHFLCKIPAITTTLGTVDQLQTFYGQTNIWEANGADISAHVRVMPE